MSAMTTRHQPGTTATPPEVPHVEVRTTALSTVLLCGDRAWKFRKPVVYPFIDQRDITEQRRLCEREVELNSRLAPDVYLGVVDALDPDTGQTRPATLMRRLPDDRRLATLIRSGQDVRHQLSEIAHVMATFHLHASCGPLIAQAGTPAAVKARWHGALDGLARFAGELLDADAVGEVGRMADEYIDGRAPLFASRMADDRVVDGHGDLLADDIFCLDSGPAILDCLEFDDTLRCCDAVSDVASLAMECERLGRDDLGEHFLREYAAHTADPFPPSLADHYMAYRAIVRCEVACLRHEQGDVDAADQARLLLAIAHRHLVRGTVMWALIGGPPGVGKSTLASGLAAAMKWTVLRSDEVRRNVIGAGLNWHGTSEWLANHFSPEATLVTYGELVHRARQVSDMGESVVLDATWSSAALRALASREAGEAHCACRSLRCDAPVDVAEARIGRRIAAGIDISMATADIARRIGAAFEPWPEAMVISTITPVGDSLAAVVQALNGGDRAARGPIRDG
jgi:aminoglycoside phosphotransferase family enzyme/predicted kinase